MDNIKCFILISIVLITFSGCNDDQNENTLHPDEGGMILAMDWPDVTTAIPPAYQVRVTSSSGKTQLFEDLSGTDNLLKVEPGEATVLVYNQAENVTVLGKRATIVNNGAGISANAGPFFSYSGQVHAGHGKPVVHTASMNRKTGEFRLSFAIKPAAMISRIKRIDAVLEGVASEIDLETDKMYGSSQISATLSKSAYYAGMTAGLFGFDSSTGQNLELKIELENGHTVRIANDLTSLVADFNTSKNSFFSLNAEMYLSDGNTPTATLVNWERNAENRYLSVSAPEISLPYYIAEESVTVTTDQPSWGYSIVKTDDWLTVAKTDTRLKISASENTSTEPRRAAIYVSAGGLNEKITVTQEGSAAGSYSDKEVVQLQRAAVGNGINIVLMGDGYTTKDMTKRTGKYEKDMRAAADGFFSVYPYTKYRDYFNVYLVTALSREEGISIEATNTRVDTKFESSWEGGRSTGINCNSYTVVEYVETISELSSADIHDITVIMPINADIYAGTCSMHFPDYSSGYGEGFSISMCPVGRDFEKIVVHEAAGHGFSKVIDEYIYYPDETIPEEDKEKIRSYKTWGWCENVDFHSNLSQTSWKDFANNPKYHMVGLFEGASMYGKGIWRPERNSCMNNSIPYFNAPTRWAQVRRIMHLAGFNYSFSAFLQEDIIPEYPSEIRSKTEDFKPLAPPVMKKLDRNKIKRNK